MAKKQDKNLFQKLTDLFRSGPVVKRKIRSFDTAVMVPDKTKSSGALLFQKSQAPTYATITANAYNLSERLMRYQDFNEMEYCLHGGTRIAVPGGYKTLEGLSVECTNNPDHTFIVYAYDHNLGRIIPALGKQARQTRVDESFLVKFDNGQEIIGTSNHRLMKRDGTFCTIEDLRPGDAMMPFYRRDLFSGGKDECEGYRWIYTMDNRSGMKGWTEEHRLIGEWMKGSPLEPGEVVHHCLNGEQWSSDNSAWIGKLKESLSQFMSQNNLAERKDITFGRILELAERFSFSSKKICVALDADLNVIERRLKSAGYSNFETFERAYNPNWNNSVQNNPRYNHSVSFDTICSAFKQGQTIKELSHKIGTTPQVITGRLKSHGYDGFNSFSQSYNNLKVVSVEPYGVIPLYDLTVDGYKNFATDSVISHNTPEIAAALDIYSDETVAQDEKGRVLHIFSDNEKIRDILEDLFYNTLNVEFNLRSWARNLVKFGDFFLYNDVHPDYGVVSAFPIPVNEIEREENYDPNDPMAVRFRWVTLGNRTLENWEVTHFRLLGNDMFLPYGSSVIEPARRIWRQLILIEDAMLVYRVVRAPERRVFYIDVANIPAAEVPTYVEEQRKNLRSNQVIDRNSGRVDLRYNPMPIHKDTPIPLLDGTTLTIESLSKKMNDNKDWIPWVYSVQDGTKKIVPGKVTWCGKNYTAETLVKVTLDDGTYIITAPEHPFVMRDGGSKRADEIVIGDSLMSAYRDINNKGYERIIEPDGTRNYTHAIVARDFYKEKWENTPNRVVHHKHPELGVANKRNNTPDNLKVMNFWDHRKMHSEHCEKTLNTPALLEIRRTKRVEYNKSSEKRRRTSELNKLLKKAERMGSAYNGTDLHKFHNTIRRDAQIQSWSSNKDSRIESMRWIIPNEIMSFVFESIKENPKISREEITNLLRANHSLIRLLSDANSKVRRGVNKFHVLAIVNKLYRMGCIHKPTFKIFRSFAINNFTPVNHQVVNIENINENVDVYCMTVVGPNEEDDRHNFAVNGLETESFEVKNSHKSLVFLWNSVDEDFYIPVRGTDTGTRIETLAGGQNTAAVEDVAYIQKKLFAALKIPRAYLGYDEMLSCVVPETKVDLLDGRSLSLEEIKTELEAGKSLWVYSVDPETREMKPGKILWCGPTRKDADLVRVTLDNGKTFDTTPDHKWMLRDGSWCQAGDLKPGSSLMPLYKRQKSMNGGATYEQVFDPSTGKWVWTHRLVTDRSGVVESHPSSLTEGKSVVHHRDINRFNNNPDNLIVMGYDAHRQLHVDLLDETRKVALREGKYSGLNNGWAAACREKVQHLWSMQSLITWCQSSRPTSKRQIVRGYGLPETQLDSLLRENGMSYGDFATNYVSGGYKLSRPGNKGTFSHRPHKKINGGRGSRGAHYEVRACPQCGAHFEISSLNKKIFCGSSCRYSWVRGRAKSDMTGPPVIVIRPGLLNHTVLSVDSLSEKRDTWCMEVAGVHTFGLTGGSIISNSKATLAQEDIRFSRTINVIQRVMLSELNKLAIIHLYANGFDGEDLQNFVLRLSNPSTIAQQQKLELWRAKFEIAGAAPEGYVSKNFVRKEIWGLNDEDCKKIDDGRMKDKMVDQDIESSIAGGGGGDASDGDDPFGGGGGDDLFGGGDAGGDDAGGGEENAADDPMKDEDNEDNRILLSSLDNDDDSFTVNMFNSDTPIRGSNRIGRRFSEQKRTRKKERSPRRSKHEKHLPDLFNIVNDQPSLDSDPFGMVEPPFKSSDFRFESRERTSIPSDVLSSLRNLTKRFGPRNNILSEHNNVEDRELFILDEDD